MISQSSLIPPPLPGIETVHRLLGRIRYQIPKLYRAAALGHHLEAQLAQHAEVYSVTANPLTGRMLVIFDPDQTDRIAELIEKALHHYQPPESTAPKSSPSAPSQPAPRWHSLDSQAICQRLDASDQGLTADMVSERQQQYGANQLIESQPRSEWSILAEQFQSLPVALLGGAAVLSTATGSLVDAAVILGVVGINAAIGYFTESQSEQIIRSLQGEEQPAQVVRAGQVQTVPAAEIVPGDMLVLEAGQVVAADARLIAATRLRVNESSLTGESIAVKKQVQPLAGEDLPLGERDNMVYKGTLITEGNGRGVVVATGSATEIGQIQRLVGETRAEATPLQRQLDEVGSQLVWLGGSVCGGVFALGLLRGYGMLPMLQTAVSLAVAAVPESLPTIATTTLALGMGDMRDRHMLMRGLQAVEALGSVQTICLDKTGTLTENRMVVREVHLDKSLEPRRQQFLGQTAVGVDDCDELRWLLWVGVLCSESEVVRQDGDYCLRGSATENALVQMAIDANIDVAALRQRYPRQRTYLRSQDRNIMSTVHSDGDQFFAAVKGSPVEVLECCQFWLREGQVQSLDNSQRRTLELDNERMASKALRVLAMAYKQMDSDQEDPEQGLIWLGMTGMADPIRPGVDGLIQRFHQAGIKTVMITGDQSPTAYAIAKELHLSRHRQTEILDSSDLAGLPPEKRQALFDKVDVFARVSPASKLEIVQALQEVGQVVAMTGDGINDMPALKAADVGIAMGTGGSNVVHDVADVVIEDDNLQTLINAVSRGRTTYSNIRKSVHFLLATNMGEIIITTLTTAAGLGEPLNTLQLLWLNLVTDTFPGLALAMEPPEPDVLSRPPRDPQTPILQRSDFTRIGLEAATLSLGALAAYSYGLMRYGQGPKANTTLFMSLTISQVLHTWSCRSENHSLFSPQSLPRNPYVEAAIAASLGLQLLPVVFPPLGQLLRLAPLDPLDWSIVAASALLSLGVNESTKAANLPSDLIAYNNS